MKGLVHYAPAMRPTFARRHSVPASPAVFDIGVLGSINEDTIERADGSLQHSLGGALFTACALAHMAGQAARVWLLARVSTALDERLRRQLRGVQGLRLDGLLPISGLGYRCHISYDPEGDKTEVLHGEVAALTPGELAEFLPPLQALVVNFITGDEITCQDLALVRKQVAGPLFVDIHSLTLGRRSNGTRFPRPLAQAGSWLAQADVLQMNEFEARVLGAPVGTEALLDWAASRLDFGPGTVVITRGALDAVVAWRNQQGTVERLVQPASPVGPDGQLDPTGCGDVFLAALAAAHVRGLDLPTSMQQASRAAALNCQLNGTEELYRLAQ